jgi:hypothetical protein
MRIALTHMVPIGSSVSAAARALADPEDDRDADDQA